jgi:hypothetical protein
MDHFIYDEKTSKDHQVFLFLDNHESHTTVPAIPKCLVLRFLPYIS